MVALRTALGVSRALIGVGAWVAPDTTVGLFGMDPGRSERFVTRLFGAREIALAGTLLAARPGSLSTVAGVGVAVDLVDAVAGFDERRRGNLSTRATVLGPVGAVGFAVLGALLAREAAAGR